MELALTYLLPASKEIKRLLSLQDREPYSLTYGSFDRTFWSWKFTDFPGARFQEGVYSLAYFYSNNFSENELYHSQHVLEWAKAGFRYWQSIQYQNGSFDEAYPQEHSLAATAFTGFYLGEAFLLLQNHLSPKEISNLEKTFCSAADWLCSNDETHGILSNHLAAAAAALCVIHKITKKQLYLDRMQYFLQKIYSHQSEEGWYEEYGGADPGYQTHATFYLARIWQITRDPILFKSLERSIEFLQYCIHPNQTLGGEYASRNTEFYFPAGLEILAEKVPRAAAIACFLRSGVQKQTVVGISAMDAYNFFPILNNYLFAADNVTVSEKKEVLAWEQPCERFFKSAGIYFKSTSHYYAILGLSKGATLKIFDRQKKSLIHSDAGYFTKTAANQVFSSQRLVRHGHWQIPSNNEIKATCPFYLANRRIPDPLLFLGFRIFSLTFGRIPWCAYLIKNILVKVLVKNSTVCPLYLERIVRFEEKAIEYKDTLVLEHAMELLELKSLPKFSTIHMGSSRYFESQELSNFISNEIDDKSQELMVKKRISIAKKINL